MISVVYITYSVGGRRLEKLESKLPYLSLPLTSFLPPLLPLPPLPPLQGLNVALFWDKVDFKEYIPLVPTSAHTGDGMGDLISLLVTYSQRMLAPKLMLSQELEAVVLEVRCEDITCFYLSLHPLLPPPSSLLPPPSSLLPTCASSPSSLSLSSFLRPGESHCRSWYHC